MKKLYFFNSKKQKLVGILDEPNDKKHEIIIICHGFSSSKYGLTSRTMVEELTKRNINSFRFDFNGCGESEGTFEEVTVSQYTDDLESAMGFMKELGYKEISLFGGSNGALVCIAAALKHAEIKKLALKCPVPDSVEVWMKKLNEHGLEEWKQRGYTHYFDKKGKKFKVHHAFFEDIKKYIMYDKVDKIKCPVLIIHGDQDKTVPLKQSEKLVKNLKNGKLIVIKGANHFFEGDNYIKKVNKIFADWFEEK